MTSTLEMTSPFIAKLPLVACDTCLAWTWPERKDTGAGFKNRWSFLLFNYTPWLPGGQAQWHLPLHCKFRYSNHRHKMFVL